MTSPNHTIAVGPIQIPKPIMSPLLIVSLALYPAIWISPGPGRCLAGTVIVIGLIWLILRIQRCIGRDVNAQIREITAQVIAELDSEWEDQVDAIIQHVMTDPDGWTQPGSPK